MNQKEAEKLCLCKNCPSYVECKQLTFCFTDTSKCIKEAKGCICPNCPVHKEMKFRGWYYCLEGKEE
jgi:hypothetical protein